MVELIKKNENGLNTKVCFEVQSKDAVIVDFIKFISGDNNKWHVNNVTTDALIKDLFCLKFTIVKILNNILLIILQTI